MKKIILALSSIFILYSLLLVLKTNYSADKELGDINISENITNKYEFTCPPHIILHFSIKIIDDKYSWKENKYKSNLKLNILLKNTENKLFMIKFLMKKVSHMVIGILLIMQ